MDASWHPYRRAVGKGYDFVTGRAEIADLKASISDSIRRLLTWSDEQNESVIALRRWLELANACESGAMAPGDLARWILEQERLWPDPRFY
jgi:hypothetical protein